MSMETALPTLTDSQLDGIELALSCAPDAARLRIEVELEQLRRGRPRYGPRVASRFRSCKANGEDILKAGFRLIEVALRIKRVMAMGAPSRARGKRLLHSIPEAFEAGIDLALGISTASAAAPPEAGSAWFRALADGIEAVEKAKVTGSLATRRTVAAGIEFVRLTRARAEVPTWAEVRAKIEVDEDLFDTASDGDWRHTRKQAGLDFLDDGEAPPVIAPRLDRKESIKRKIQVEEAEALRRWREGR